MRLHAPTRTAARSLIAVGTHRLASGMRHRRREGGPVRSRPRAEGVAAAATSVTLIEQPWVDLQVENEIAQAVAREAGLQGQGRHRSRSRSAQQALASGETPTRISATGGRRKSRPTQSLIDDGKVDVVNEELLTGTEYAPAVPGDVAEELGITSLADLDEHARRVRPEDLRHRGRIARQRDDPEGDRRRRLRSRRLEARRERDAGDAGPGREVDQGRRADRVPGLEPALDDRRVQDRLPGGPAKACGAVRARSGRSTRAGLRRRCTADRRAARRT